MAAIDREFVRRVSPIPHHGFGLSVDVYQPDLFALLTALEQHGVSFGYLEVFQASTRALTEVRRRLPGALLEYHGEGLWVTQPDFLSRYPVEVEVLEAAEQLRTLGSWWANYEGAAKQMAGYSFGTYLPPLFTLAGADVTAANIAWVQKRLDQLAPVASGTGPLILLETPPLTYFGFGDIDMADFFRAVTDQVACGVVLDIGHLWTVYRYSENYRQLPLERFLQDFLDRFPLERVVHVHAAGLAIHEQMQSRWEDSNPPDSLPRWIDTHGAPIPEVLFDMLEQVLSHAGLSQIKGLALEVDTKAISEIVGEFQRFQNRFSRWMEAVTGTAEPGISSSSSPSHIPAMPAKVIGRDWRKALLLQQYRTYVQIVTGCAQPDASVLPSCWCEPEWLDFYRRTYLPNEILHWGGDLSAMFPDTCLALKRAGVALEDFVKFWFNEPREFIDRYDFFHLKLNMFAAFVTEVLPEAVETVNREATTLRVGYEVACLQVSSDG